LTEAKEVSLFLVPGTLRQIGKIFMLLNLPSWLLVAAERVSRLLRAMSNTMIDFKLLFMRREANCPMIVSRSASLTFNAR